MALKSELLNCAKRPEEVRKLLSDQEVVRQLELAGIELRFYELHAPAVGAKKSRGLGVTLCGRHRGMRSSVVTCKKCLARSEKPID